MFLPASLLVVSADIFHKALVDELGTIGTQMETHSGSENGRSAWNDLYDTTP
jgi:hypothetical protein